MFPFGVGPPCLQQQQARSPVSSQQWVAGRLLGTPLSGYLVSGAALTWWGPPDDQCTKPKEKAPTAMSILCSDDLDEDITCSSLVCFGCSGSSLWRTGSTARCSVQPFSSCDARAIEWVGSVVASVAACGILVHRPGLKTASPALEGGYLTTGLRQEIEGLQVRHYSWPPVCISWSTKMWASGWILDNC